MITFTLFYSEEDYRILNLQNIVEYNHVLDYNIVKNKLTKVDYLKKTPSDSIVSYYMFKKLSTMIKEADDGSNILYILKSVSGELIDNIETVLENLCSVHKKDFEFQVIVKTRSIDSALIETYNIQNLYDKS